MGDSPLISTGFESDLQCFGDTQWVWWIFLDELISFIRGGYYIFSHFALLKDRINVKYEFRRLSRYTLSTRLDHRSSIISPWGTSCRFSSLLTTCEIIMFFISSQKKLVWPPTAGIVLTDLLVKSAGGSCRSDHISDLIPHRRFEGVKRRPNGLEMEMERNESSFMIKCHVL